MKTKLKDTVQRKIINMMEIDIKVVQSYREGWRQ